MFNAAFTSASSVCPTKLNNQRLESPRFRLRSAVYLGESMCSDPHSSYRLATFV